MILASAARALRDPLLPALPAALWKSLGLTAVVLVALWFAVRWLFEVVAIPFFAQFSPDMPAWVDNAGTFAGWAASIALAFLLAFLIAPVSAVIAGLFLDDVADVVERDGLSRPGRGTRDAARPLDRAVGQVLRRGDPRQPPRLRAASRAGGQCRRLLRHQRYLLGREYFEFAALRYRSEEEVRALRSRYGGTVFAAGLLLAAFLAIPILNLLTPLFAAAMMVHLHQRVSQREGGLPIAAAAPGTIETVAAQPPGRFAPAAGAEAPAARPAGRRGARPCRTTSRRPCRGRR